MAKRRKSVSTRKVFEPTDFSLYPTKAYSWTIVAPHASHAPIHYSGVRKWWPSEWHAIEYAKTILDKSPQAQLVAMQAHSITSEPLNPKTTALPAKEPD